MSPKPVPRRVPVPLDLLPFPGSHEDSVRTSCPNCSSRLTLHQPDPESPDRLLGTCQGCKRWYLVDLIGDASGGVLLGLPEGEVVRALSRPNPSEGISLMGDEPDPGLIGKPGK